MSSCPEQVIFLCFAISCSLAHGVRTQTSCLLTKGNFGKHPPASGEQKLVLFNNTDISWLITCTGADPKSVVCAFYKQGQCSKGDKCKFSHDIAMDRKGEKRSLYVDARDVAEDDLKNGKYC